MQSCYIAISSQRCWIQSDKGIWDKPDLPTKGSIPRKEHPFFWDPSEPQRQGLDEVIIANKRQSFLPFISCVFIYLAQQCLSLILQIHSHFE